MGIALTRDTLFKPSRSGETKGEVTSRIVRSIIDAEAERRQLNTARLRQARLEKEALIAAETIPAKQRGAKRAGLRRTRTSR